MTSLFRAFLAGSAATGLAVAAAPASAQTFPLTGFYALPSFAWSEPTLAPGGVKWDGSYARISAGYQISSSRRGGSSSGPTIGFEGGKLWREGNLVWGVLGAVNYSPAASFTNPGYGYANYSQDFAGALQLKAGVLLQENVLLYTKLGVAAVNETWRVGPYSTPAGLTAPGFSRSDVVVRPEARAGIEWAVTDRLTLGFEVGVTGQSIR